MRRKRQIPQPLSDEQEEEIYQEYIEQLGQIAEWYQAARRDGLNDRAQDLYWLSVHTRRSMHEFFREQQFLRWQAAAQKQTPARRRTAQPSKSAASSVKVAYNISSQPTHIDPERLKADTPREQAN